MASSFFIVKDSGSWSVMFALIEARLRESIPRRKFVVFARLANQTELSGHGFIIHGIPGSGSVELRIFTPVWPVSVIFGLRTTFRYPLDPACRLRMTCVDALYGRIYHC
jgi:hypothetical protein